MENKNTLLLGLGIGLLVLTIAWSTLVSGHSDYVTDDNYMMEDEEHMDLDEDGICDYCGMEVEACEGMEDMCHMSNMHENMESHHERMHRNMMGGMH